MCGYSFLHTTVDDYSNYFAVVCLRKLKERGNFFINHILKRGNIMVKVLHGNTVIEGQLKGYSPGTNEFEIDLGPGLKVLISARDSQEGDMFSRMRIAMNNVGLLKLKSSVLNFKKGSIELLDPNPNDVIPETTSDIKTAFIG